MALSNYLADKLYDHVLRNTAYTSPTTVYLALFTVLPSAAGTGGTEVTGGSYARQALVVTNPALGAQPYNSAQINFTAMPACTVVGAGLYDASTAGNMLFFGRYSTARVVAAGAPLQVLVGDLVVGMF